MVERPSPKIRRYNGAQDDGWLNMKKASWFGPKRATVNKKEPGWAFRCVGGGASPVTGN